jgi:ribosomal protein S12 methylthiotransferase
MIDEIGKDGAVARSHWDAPEIDGNVYLRGVRRLQPGDRLEVVVHGADAYDLWGSPV